MIALAVVLIALVIGASRFCRGRHEAAMREGGGEESPTGQTGGEAAAEFLRENEAGDVQIAVHDGFASDYFDPRRRRLFLSTASHDGRSLAAWATALHEAAHALQTGDALPELKWRQSCIRMSRYLPTLAAVAAIVLKFLVKMPLQPLLLGMAAVWALVLALNIGTLAIERNANLRLRKHLDDKLRKHPSARDKMDPLLSAMALREVGDFSRSPKFFLYSALPGSSKLRPR